MIIRFFAFGMACCGLAWAGPLWGNDSLALDLPWKTKFSDSNKTLKLALAIQDSSRIWTLNSKNEKRNIVFADAKMFFSIAERFHFKTAVRVATEWTTIPIFMHSYEPYLGIPFNPQVIDSSGGTNKKTWDYLATTSSWDLDWIKLSAGLDYIQTGPGVRQHLMWSGDQNTLRPWHFGDPKSYQTAPVFFGAWDLPFKNLRYRQWSGTLSERKDLSKYFHSQRLDVLGNWWNFGFTQSVAYGSLLSPQDTLEEPWPRDQRVMQWAYTLPFIPYYFSQHILGDRENSLMSMDLEMHSWGQRIYGELLLDDLKSPTALFKDDWWGNKFGAMFGVELQKTWSSLGTRFVFEQTHIEPWVYTHRYGRGLNWEHYGQSLGSDLGANASESWALIELAHPWVGQVSAAGLYTRKGFDHGSDIRDIHYTWDRMDKTYLNPDSTLNYTEWTLAWRRTFFKGVALNLFATRYVGSWSGFGLGGGMRFGI